jgi:hypothetical protein
MAQEMIRSGWLTFQDGKYKITTEGERATAVTDYEQPQPAPQEEHQRRCLKCGVPARLTNRLKPYWVQPYFPTVRVPPVRRAHDETAEVRLIPV